MLSDSSYSYDPAAVSFMSAHDDANDDSCSHYTITLHPTKNLEEQYLLNRPLGVSIPDSIYCLCYVQQMDGTLTKVISNCIIIISIYGSRLIIKS
jgi:hypothetical protein